MKKFISIIYNAIPFKAAVFKIVKMLWSPPHSIYQHLHFTGIINIKVDGNSSFKMHHYGFELENEVFWKGLENGWENVSVGIWKKLAGDAGVVFDVGANTGIYTLITKAINPQARVYAFEPLPWICQKMQKNFSLNNFDVSSYEYALSDYTGTAKVFLEEDEIHVYSVTVNKNMLHQNKGVEREIRTITIADIIEQNKIDKIDVLKIDVETHEVEVLRGMGKYLDIMRPAMLIEILNDEVGEGVQNLLKDKGYLYFNIDELGGVRQVSSITKSDYYNYLVCNETIAHKLGLLQ